MTTHGVSVLMDALRGLSCSSAISPKWSPSSRVSILPALAALGVRRQHGHLPAHQDVEAIAAVVLRKDRFVRGVIFRRKLVGNGFQVVQ